MRERGQLLQGPWKPSPIKKLLWREVMAVVRAGDGPFIG